MKKLVLAALLCASSAQAGECKLAMVGSLDFTMGDSDARVLVDADLGQVKGKVIVDTGGFATMLSQEVADALKVHRFKLEHDFYATGYGGTRYRWVGVLPSLRIGGFHSSDVHFFIDPHWNEKDTIGLIGADFLKQFDVEFDFARRKMNFFSQDHCPGQVVYWTHDPVAILPIKVTEEGHIRTKVSMDGKEVDTLIDTGAPFTSLTMSGARKLFDVTDKSPSFAKVPDWPGHFTYGFKTLALGDIAFGNPKVHIIDVTDDDDRTMLLGLHDLKKLHLFVSYKEHMLYATPADAH